MATILTRIKNNQITDRTITNVKLANGTITGNEMNANLTFNSNLILNGNLLVAGSTTTVQSNVTQINDPLLALGVGNPGTSYDLGLILDRAGADNRYIGWKENLNAFAIGYTTEDGTTMGNIALSGYANLIVGNLVTTGATSFGNIVIDGVTNTIYDTAANLNLQGAGGYIVTPNAFVATGGITQTSIGVNGANVGFFTEVNVGGNIIADYITANLTVTAAGGTLTGNLNMTNVWINNVANPVQNQDAATKYYVDNLSQMANGTSNIKIALNSNITANVNNALIATVYSGGVVVVGDVAAGTGTFATNLSAANLSIGTNAVVQDLTSNTNVTAVGGYFSTVQTTANATLNALVVNTSAQYNGNIQSTDPTTGTIVVTNVGGVGIGGALNVQQNSKFYSNLIVAGNLIVQGNTTTIGSNNFSTVDNIIEVHTNEALTPLTVDDGYDLGLRFHYFKTQNDAAALVWANDTGFLEFYGNGAIDNERIVSGATYGTIKTGNIQLTDTLLTVNANVTNTLITSNLIITGGLQNTVIGNVTPSEASFTNANANLGTFVNANVTNTLTTNNLTVFGGIQNTPIGNATPSTGNFTNLVANTSALMANLTVNTTANIGGNITSDGLTTVNSAVIGTTLQAVGGLQNTVIGNVTAADANFTNVNVSATLTATNGNAVATGTSTGAVILNGNAGAGIGGNLFVGGQGTLGNIAFANLTLSSNVADQNLNLDTTGNGYVVLNSALSSSAVVINGTSSNVLVVTANTVGMGNANTSIANAILNLGGTTSMVLPVGTDIQRPAPAVTGMFRYSTSQGSVEWFDGSTWENAGTKFTVAVANTQVGDNTTTQFTLPATAGNVSTAGCMVSINGVVQRPLDSYTVTGGVVTFSEAPLTTDIIDFRTFTTTTTLTGLQDTFGNTGVFVDHFYSGDKTVAILNNGVNTVNIDVGGNIVMNTGGIISNTASVTVGTTSTAIDSWSAFTYKAAKYFVTARDASSTTWTTVEALVVTSGAAVKITTYGALTVGMSSADQITLNATIAGGVVSINAVGAGAGTVVTYDKTLMVGK